LAEILYRKWRPQLFSQLAGQEHVATTLRNALQQKRIAHAYLFAGPRGTGKTTTGRLLGRALNCSDLQSGEPCNRCPSCVDLIAGRAFDLIELDAASNRGIEEIRRLRDNVAVTTASGPFKVYLIDEVHMLTEAAFNALLKTLEEPPPHVVFILATTDAHKVPATITSRCQRFDFRRAPLDAMVANLQRICAGEGITCEPEALELIGRSATGSHRDAVNLLDQLATSYGNDLSAEHVRSGLGLIGDERSARLARMAIGGDLAGGLELIASVRDDGLDLRQFQRELVAELRDLLMVRSGLPAGQSGVTVERRREMEEAVAGVASARLLTALRAFGEADLKPDPNSTLPLDIALAECALAGEGDPARRDVGAGAQSRPGPTAAPSGLRPAPRAPASTPASNPAEPAATDAEAGTADTEAGAEAAAVTVGAARQVLQAIYDEARRRSVPLGALLNSDCDIIGADGDAVVFGFRHLLHAEKAASKQNLETLSEVASRVLRRQVTVRCVHDSSVGSWRQREPASRSALVRAAQEMGARILSPGPEE
jgi:DNA polymerase-3 subunit gamma/tau